MNKLRDDKVLELRRLQKRAMEYETSVEFIRYLEELEDKVDALEDKLNEEKA